MVTPMKMYCSHQKSCGVNVMRSGLVIWVRVTADLKASLGQDRYTGVINAAAHEYGFDGGLKAHALMIGNHLAMAHGAGMASLTLDRLCDAIISM